MALCLLHLAAELVARELVHTVILIEEYVRRDVVVDELDDEVYRVLRRPIELLVISDVPLVLTVSRGEEKWLVYVCDFLHE